MMITSSNLILSMIGMETTLMVLKTQKKNQLKIQKMLRTSAKVVKVLEMKSKMILILTQPVLIGNGMILDGVVLAPQIMTMTATMKIFSTLMKK